MLHSYFKVFCIILVNLYKIPSNKIEIWTLKFIKITVLFMQNVSGLTRHFFKDLVIYVLRFWDMLFIAVGFMLAPKSPD